ncbi:hypothetical protein IJ750_03950 [bacterium]|nr:hypothetical protein [bacterium]
MNITVNELLLKKVKFGANPASTTEAPAPEVSNPQTGMNALTFEGMKNLMSNPTLAQEVGVPSEEAAQPTDAKSYVAPFSSNMAFQGKGAKVARKALMGTLAAAMLASATGVLTSCQPDVRVEVKQEVNFDMALLAELINGLKAEIAGLKAELQGLRGDLKAQTEELIKAKQEILNMLLDMQSQNNTNIKELQTMLLGKMDLMLTILEAQGLKSDKANQLLEEILYSNMDANRLLAAIRALVSDIKTMVSEINTKMDKMDATAQKILQYVKGTYVNTNTLVNQGEEYKKYLDEAVVYLDMLLRKADAIQLDMNANSEKLAEQLGIQHSELIALLKRLGKSEAEIMQMSTAQILAALKQLKNATEANGDKLTAILEKLQNGTISQDEAIQQIIALLTSIDTNVKELLNEVKAARAILCELRNNSRANLQQNAYMISQLQTLINGQNVIASKIDKNTATMQEVANQLGMSLDELKAMLQQMGCTMVQIQKMTAADIIKAINRNTQQLQCVMNMLQYIAKLVEQGFLSNDCANKMIIELLKNIDANVDSIKSSIANYYSGNADILAKLDKIIENQNQALENQGAQIEIAGQQTVILNSILSMLKNGVSKDDVAVIIDLLSKGNCDMNKLINLVTALNQNVSDGRAENRKFAEDVLAMLKKYGDGLMGQMSTVINLINSSNAEGEKLRDLVQKFIEAYNANNKVTQAQLKAILDAIANIHIDGGQQFDSEGFKAMLEQIIALLKTNNNLLSGIDAKIALINTSQQVIIDKLDNLAKNIPNYKQDLNEIKALLEALKNKPGYDDSAIVAKLDALMEILLTHEFCHCNCSGSGNGNHEGILGDMLHCLKN